MKTPGDDGRYNESLSKMETRDVLEGKKTKASVHYRPQMEDSVETCFDCTYYCAIGKPESDCTKVAGMVRAEWICDLWELSTASDNSGDKPSSAVQVNINFSLGQGS